MHEVVYIFLGMPGSGKDLQATRLAERLDGVCISSGEEMRRGQEEADRAAQAEQSQGLIVQSSFFEHVMHRALARVESGIPIVLSGVTRRATEIDWLIGELGSLGRSITAVIYLEIPEEIGQERIKLRRSHDARNDDDPMIQDRRIEEFKTLTMRSIERYDELGLLHRIDGVGSIDEIADRIAVELDLP